MKPRRSSKSANLRIVLVASTFLSVLIDAAACRAQSPQAQPSLGEKFRTMQRDWDAQSRARTDGSAATRSTRPDEFITRYIALAEEHPKDSETCEALLWLSSRFRKMTGMDKAEGLLRRECPLAGEYLDLKREYDEAQEKYFEVSRKAGSDEERRKAYDEHYPKPEKFAGRFLAIARKEPQSPVGKEALVWIIQQARQGADFDAAIELVLQHHARRPGIGVVCSSLVYSQSASAEKLMREVADKNPDNETKGTAQLALARYLARKADGIQQLKGGSLSAEQLAQAEAYYGKEHMQKLRATDPAALSEEAEKLFDQVANQFADVKTYSGTLADEAKSELFEARSLGLGKVAPEIEGDDIDGKKFKLSDYRGKVVVIDFWGDW